MLQVDRVHSGRWGGPSVQRAVLQLTPARKASRAREALDPNGARQLDAGPTGWPRPAHPPRYSPTPSLLFKCNLVFISECSYTTAYYSVSKVVGVGSVEVSSALVCSLSRRRGPRGRAE